MPNLNKNTVLLGIIISLLFIGASGQPARAEGNPLHITKTAVSSFANPDTSIDYTITVTNQSSDSLSNLVVAEAWPTEFTLNGQAGGFVTWTIDTLTSGASSTNVVKVLIPKSVPAGSYVSRTTVISQTPPVQEVRQDTLEIRPVTVLSSHLPSTGGNPIGVITLLLILNFSLIAAYNLNRYFTSHATNRQ